MKGMYGLPHTSATGTTAPGAGPAGGSVSHGLASFSSAAAQPPASTRHHNMLWWRVSGCAARIQP